MAQRITATDSKSTWTNLQDRGQPASPKSKLPQSPEITPWGSRLSLVSGILIRRIQIAGTVPTEQRATTLSISYETKRNNETINPCLNLIVDEKRAPGAMVGLGQPHPNNGRFLFYPLFTRKA